MKNKYIILITIFLIFIVTFSLNVFATADISDSTSSDTTPAVQDTTAYEEENNNVTYTPQSSYSNSPYVTSVTQVSSQSQANLELNNILSILLISIVILLILFSIAILIRIKK